MKIGLNRTNVHGWQTWTGSELARALGLSGKAVRRILDQLTEARDLVPLLAALRTGLASR